jgi:hypothetical protein
VRHVVLRGRLAVWPNAAAAANSRTAVIMALFMLISFMEILVKE